MPWKMPLQDNVVFRQRRGEEDVCLYVIAREGKCVCVCVEERGLCLSICHGNWKINIFLNESSLKRLSPLKKMKKKAKHLPYLAAFVYIPGLIGKHWIIHSLWVAPL